ncbi:MAG: ABC-2 transporter permease [Firmicutes bacterium]|jgi:ABC-2 type transport system permease protein|nr:ABC-2 transporter permease [Bacillota bacterium]
MVTLVLKDLLVQKKLLGLELAYILVLSYAFRTMGEWLPLSIISTVGFMFVILSGAWDDRASADRLWNSLPVPKWQIVGSRYLAVFVWTALAAVLTCIALVVLPKLGFPTTSEGVSLDKAAAGVGTVMVLTSIFLPVYFAFGYTKSRVLNILVFTSSISLAGMVSNFMAGRPAWVEAVAQIGSFSMWGASTFVVILLLALSFALSLKLYQRREF